MFQRTIHHVVVLCLLVIVFSACAPADSTQPLTPVTIQLNRTHGAQLGGFYVAVQNGYYAREGLDVTFLEGGASVDTLSVVRDGKAQFGLVAGDVLLLGRAQGQPLEAIATIFRREPFVFFSLADSGITRPEDFAGKKVLVSNASRPRLYTILGKVGVSPEQVTEVTTGDFTGLYDKTVDVAGGFVNNAVLQVRHAGYEVNIIYLDNYGIHFYSDTLFASDDFIAKNPELITRFLRATFDGWSFAIEHPADIGAMALKYNPTLDGALETAKMTASLPYVNTGEDHIGWMKPEIWAGMAKVLHEQGILTTPLDPTEIYTLQFVEEIYSGAQS